LQVDLRCDRGFLRFFFAGQSDAQHLRLIQQPNERRIRVELHFPDDEALGAALFAWFDREPAPGLRKGGEPELSRNRMGWGYGATLPLANASRLIRHFTDAMMSALDQS
jgi:hypothetical protein